MGGVQSTTSDGSVRTQDSAEYHLGEFIGEKSYPLGSKLWQQLFEHPLDHRWQRDHIDRAFKLKIMSIRDIWHLAWCFQDWKSNAGGQSSVFLKAINALYITSVFLKHLIENAKTENFEELYLSLDESEPVPIDSIRGEDVPRICIPFPYFHRRNS